MKTYKVCYQGPYGCVVVDEFFFRNDAEVFIAECLALGDDSHYYIREVENYD